MTIKCCKNVVTQIRTGFHQYIRLPLHVLRSHIYALAKPLTAVLQYINVYACNQVLEEDN